MSDSEAISDWEAESVASDDEVVAPQPAQKRTDNAKPASTTTKPGEFEIPAHLQHALDDPDDERERLQMVQELRDLSLGGDMFGVSADDVNQDFQERSRNLLARIVASGAVSSGGRRPRGDGESLETLSVKRVQDVDALINVLCPKIMDSACKSQTWLRFMDRILAAVSAKMEPADLKALEKKVNLAQKSRQLAINEAAQKSKKGSDLRVNIRDPTGELDIYDGVDDERSDNEYDDYI